MKSEYQKEALAQIIDEVLPYFSNSQMAELVAALSRLPHENLKRSILDVLARHINNSPGKLEDILHSVESDYQKASILSCFISSPPLLPVKSLDDAAHNFIKEPDNLTNFLLLLVRYTPEPRKTSLINELLSLIVTIEQVQLRCWKLKDLIEAVSPQFAERCFLLAENCKSSSYYPDVLNALAQISPSKLKPRIEAGLLQYIKNSKNQYWENFQAYNGLSHISNTKSAPKIIKALKMLPSYSKASMIASLPEKFRATHREDLLKIADSIKEVYERVDSLLSLARVSPKKQKVELFVKALKEMADKADYYGWRWSRLINLIPRLPKSAIPEILETVEKIKNPKIKASVVKSLAKSLPARYSTRLYDIARSIKSPVEQAESLAAVIPVLRNPYKALVLEEIFEAVKKVAEPDSKSRILFAALPHLSASQLSETVSRILKLFPKMESWTRSRHIRNIADYVSDEQIEELLQYVGDLGDLDVTEIEDFFNLIGPRMDTSHFNLLLRTIQEDDKLRARGSVLQSLVPYLPPTLYDEALEIAQSIPKFSFRRLLALEAFIPLVSGDKRIQIIKEMMPDRHSEEVFFDRDRRINFPGGAYFTGREGKLLLDSAKVMKTFQHLTSEERRILLAGTSIQDVDSPFDDAAEHWKQYLSTFRENNPGTLRNLVYIFFEHPGDSFVRQSITGTAYTNLELIAPEELRHERREWTDLEDELFTSKSAQSETTAVAASAKRENVVNTGFSSLLEADDALNPTVELSCDEQYLFWLEISPEIKFSIETALISLPNGHLPADAVLTVALFGYKNGLIIERGGDLGKLKLLPGGRAEILEKPLLPEDIMIKTSQPDKRLFFFVRTPDTPGNYKLRCNIYYEQILLQSRLIKADVGTKTETVSRALTSKVDYTIAKQLKPGTLQTSRQHSLSLMVHSNNDKTHSFRFFGSKNLKSDAVVASGELQSLIDSTRRALCAACWGDEKSWSAEKKYRYENSNIEQLRADLALLAIRGYRFYTRVAEELAGGVPEIQKMNKLMSAPGRIQIACTSSSSLLFSASLLYDYPLDTGLDLKSYALCPDFLKDLNGADSLENSKCFAGNCPTRENPQIVCPSGFWGYRHYIGMPASKQDSLSPDAEILCEIEPVIAAAISRDPRFERWDNHKKNLSLFHPAANIKVAQTRSETLTLLQEQQIHIVYFYCHGGTANDIPYLQVGNTDDAGITPDNLNAYSIHWYYPKPLVFINGCQTAAIEPRLLMSFVSAFTRVSNASGVIGTEITIFEPLACAFAECCIGEFLSGKEIGQAVRTARLSLLKAGNPLGLAYAPFVKADLRLLLPQPDIGVDDKN